MLDVLLFPGLPGGHLSLYLYHVSEDPYYRNMQGAGNDLPNVAKAPMGLCLYYILTAHHTSEAVHMDPLTQQKLLGLALKTFHDLPVITDNATIKAPTACSHWAGYPFEFWRQPGAG